MSWRKRAEHLAPSGTRGVAPLPRERRPRTARGIGAGIGIVALLAGAIGVTVAQLTATSAGAATTLGIVTGAGPGGGPDVHTYTGDGSSSAPNFFAYDGAFTGGVRVATGDFTGDGIDDIVTGPGPGGGPNIKIFDGSTGNLLASSFAFDSSFHGGVYVAVGDVNGDGKPDLLVGAGAGGTPEVKVYSGKDTSVLFDFNAFNPSYNGGVTVAAGDVNGDGFADIITGSATSDSVVNVFSGKDGTLLNNFAAYPNFQGGVSVGAADLNGDGKADIVTGAGPGGGPHVKVFDATNTNNLLASFFAYDAGFHAGVRVAGSDVNRDGTDDVITGPGPGGGPNVKVFSGKGGGSLASFYAYNPAFTGGVYVTGHAITTGPKVNSATPSSLGQGASNKDVILNGAGFVTGTTVVFSGNGVTVNGTPTVQDSGHIKVNISIDPAAAKTARDISISRPDGRTATCTGCFTVVGNPTVTSANPNSGFTGSTVQNINIAGTGFQNGAVVSFSGTGLTPSTAVFASPTQLTINLNIDPSAAPGARNITVTNPDGGAGTLVGGFTVNQGPTVASTNPSSITPGSTPTASDVVITGANFVAGGTPTTGPQATFSGTGITVNSTTFTDVNHVTANITVAPDAPHGARNVTVSNPTNGGSGSCTGCFNIGPEPTISSISPNALGQGTSNQTVTIKGNNFNSGSVVTFSPSGNVTVNGTPTNPDPNTLVLNVSVSGVATVGPYDVTVNNTAAPTGTVTCTGCFSVTAKPVVGSASPPSLGQGATKNVIISGSGFQNNPAPAVDFGPGTVVNSVSFTDASHLTANVTVNSGASPGARTIFVVNKDGGTGSCSNCFTVNTAPTVSSLNPASRAQNSPAANVVITGTGFQNGATVAFNPATGITVDTTTVNSTTQITASVTVGSSAATGPHDVTVTNPDGGAGTKPGGFTVSAGPTVTSVDNNAGGNSLQPGDTNKTVNVNGTNFAPGATVTFAPGTGVTQSGTPTVTATKITTTVSVASNAPTGPQNVTVTNTDGGSGSCTGCFSIGTAPTVASVSPSSLPAGSSNRVLNISGTNFNSSSVVSFPNDSSTLTQVGPATVNNAGSISVTVNVASTATPHAVTVQVTNSTPAAGSGSCSTCFAVSAVPTVSNVNPASLKQGQTANVVITGSGYQNGVSVVFSGAGVATTAAPTVNSNGTQITASVAVQPGAATTARDITITNPDGGAVTCNNCFAVTTGP